MPNWCWTNYKFIGESDKIKQFYDFICDVRENPPMDTMTTSYNHMAQLLTKAGVDYRNSDCGGWVVDVILSEDGRTIEVTSEDKWCPKDRGWYDLLNALNLQDDIRMLYYGEEPNCEVYETNDVNREFVTDRYVMHANVTGGDNDRYDQSYEEEADIVDDVNLIIGTNCNTFDEAVIECQKYNEENEDNRYICIHKIDVVTDKPSYSDERSTLRKIADKIIDEAKNAVQPESDGDRDGKDLV
jgi:hypothetical protein